MAVPMKIAIYELRVDGLTRAFGGYRAMDERRQDAIQLAQEQGVDCIAEILFECDEMSAEEQQAAYDAMIDDQHEAEIWAEDAWLRAAEAGPPGGYDPREL
jgi:hypothetical protein